MAPDTPTTATVAVGGDASPTIVTGTLVEPPMAEVTFTMAGGAEMPAPGPSPKVAVRGPSAAPPTGRLPTSTTVSGAVFWSSEVRAETTRSPFACPSLGVL